MKRKRPSFTQALGRMAGDSLTLWLAQMTGVGLSMVVTIFVARALGPEGRGIYTWLLTLANIGSHGALFGMDNSNRRLASAHPDRVPALLWMNVLIIGGFGTVLGVVLTFAALPLQGSGHNGTWMVLAMATVPLNALMLALGSILIARRQIKLAAAQLILPKLVMVVLFSIMLLGAWVSVGMALAFNLVVIITGVVLPLWWLRGLLAEGKTLPWRPYVESVWRTCSATFIAGLSYFVMQKVDVLLVGYFLGSEQTGFYGIASTIVDLMITPVSVIAFLLGTRLAGKDSTGGKGFSGRVIAIAMSLAVAGSAFTYVIAPWLIPLMFGVAFEPSVVLLQMLCPAVVGLCLFMLMNNILLATGRARHLAVPGIIGAVTNVGMNLWLIPAMGVMGACWSSIVAYWVAGLCATVMVGHRTLRAHGGRWISLIR